VVNLTLNILDFLFQGIGEGIGFVGMLWISGFFKFFQESGSPFPQGLYLGANNSGLPLLALESCSKSLIIQI